jgi:signal transduction histidine kinase
VNGVTKYIENEVFWRKDGSSFPVEYTSTPILEDGKLIGTVVTFLDVSQRKQSEELVLKSEKLSVVGQLAAGIAHEIRNPLTSLKGFVQLMEEGTISEKTYLMIMKEELERIETISGELLALAKPQPSNYKEENLLQILLDVIALLDTEAFKHRIKIITEFEVDMISISCVAPQLK